MKKCFSILISCTLLFSLAACGGNATPTPPQSASAAAPSQTESLPETSSAPKTSSALEVSSVPEESSSDAADVTSSESEAAQPEAPASSDTHAQSAQEPAEEEATGRSLVVYFSWSGNTESVAQEIQNQTGADSFEIVPATPYTEDYDELLDLAQEEQRSGARPAISGSVDLSGYDTIYLGYPNWWGDMPMILYTFLDEYDLSGKTVAPFCTSGGSGLSGSVGAIRSAEPGATVLDGLHIGSGNASNPADAVSQWLAGHAQ